MGSAGGSAWLACGGGAAGPGAAPAEPWGAGLPWRSPATSISLPRLTLTLACTLPHICHNCMTVRWYIIFAQC